MPCGWFAPCGVVADAKLTPGRPQTCRGPARGSGAGGGAENVVRSAQDGLGVGTDLDRETRVPPPSNMSVRGGGVPGRESDTPNFFHDDIE